MIPIWAMQAGIGAAQSIGKWAGGKLFGPQTFKDTAAGRALKRRMKTGDIGLEARQNVISGVAKTTGTQAANAKAELRGRMVASGMGGGLGEQSQVNAVDRSFREQLGDISERLFAQNEQTKIDARNEYDAGNAQFKEQKRQENQEAIGSLLGVAGKAVLGKYTDSAVKDLQQKYANQEISEGDFLRNLQNLGVDPNMYLGDNKKRIQFGSLEEEEDADPESSSWSYGGTPYRGTYKYKVRP